MKQNDEKETNHALLTRFFLSIINKIIISTIRHACEYADVSTVIQRVATQYLQREK
jgi:hypothetical protein